MGIMAGIGTVLADDPMLNVRVEGWKSPVRIVCDSKLRIPPDSQIVKSAEKYRTIVAYADQKNTEEKIKILHTMGVETIYCPDEKNQIDLKKLMADLRLPEETTMEVRLVVGKGMQYDLFLRDLPFVEPLMKAMGIGLITMGEGYEAMY